jgi:hypothetical protein
VTGVLAGPGFQCVIRRGMPEDTISYRNDNGAWLNAAEGHALVQLRRPIRPDGRGDDAAHGAGGFVDLKLGHCTKDGARAQRMLFEAANACIDRHVLEPPVLAGWASAPTLPFGRTAW